MSATDAIDEDAPKKGSKMGLIIALVLAIAAGAGGFFAAFSGMLPFGGTADSADPTQTEHEATPIADTQFIPLDPLVVSIRSSSKYRLLRFTGQLEVSPEFVADVERLKPRIVDVMNTYLNALEARYFEDPIAMIKIRAQLLRRLQIVTGEGRVKDLLIMEFVLQ